MSFRYKFFYLKPETIDRNRSGHRESQSSASTSASCGDWNSDSDRDLCHQRERNRSDNLKYKSNIVYNLVHLYSFTCHLQVISHGTIAYIVGSRGASQLEGSLLGIPLGYKAS